MRKWEKTDYFWPCTYKSALRYIYVYITTNFDFIFYYLIFILFYFKRKRKKKLIGVIHIYI